MTGLTITIETGNAAFEDDARGECARILYGLIEQLEQGSQTSAGLYDANGNRVGGFDFAERDEEAEAPECQVFHIEAHEQDLFARAATVGEAIDAWRGYYEAEPDEMPDDVRMIPATGPAGAIAWDLMPRLLKTVPVEPGEAIESQVGAKVCAGQMPGETYMEAQDRRSRELFAPINRTGKESQ